jgi:hypothetical protein
MRACANWHPLQSHGEQMRTNRPARFASGVRPAIVGVLLVVAAAMPLVGPTMVGAVSGPSKEATPPLTLTAHATRVCGPITFEWSPGQPLTYFQVHATNVGCTVAKALVAKAGKWHAATPAGWTFLGTAVRGPDCASTWKRGTARVTGYLVNTQGC